MSKPDSLPRRCGTGLVALVYLFANGPFANAAETNFWVERGRASRRARQTSATLLAKAPSAVFPGSAFPLPSMAFDFEAPAIGKIPSAAGFPVESAAWLSALSPTLGSVRGVRLPRGPVRRVVVHVQDVHGNLEAQKNIGRAVRVLVDGGAALVALEGAADPIDLGVYQDFPDRAVMEKTADILLKMGDISGPVREAFLAPVPGLRGVEDPALYAANVDAYRRSAPQKKEVLARLDNERRALAEEKRARFTPRLAALDKAVEDYRAGRVRLGDYLGALVDAGAESGPAVRAFLETLAAERSLDYVRAEAERRVALERLVPALSNEGARRLASRALACRSGDATPGAFYGEIRRLCRAAGMDMGKFPAFDAYARYAIAADAIQADALFDELNELEPAAYALLSATPELADLVRQSRRLHLAQKLAEFSLTRPEWESYQSLGGAPGLESFEDFYRFANARDEAMARRFLDSLGGSDRAVLVAGGYHARGLANRLAAEGVAVLSFVPRFDPPDPAQASDALSVFTREKTPLEKMFEGEKLFLAPRPDRGVSKAPYVAALVAGTAEVLNEFVRAQPRNGWEIERAIIEENNDKEKVLHVTLKNNLTINCRLDPVKGLVETPLNRPLLRTLIMAAKEVWLVHRARTDIREMSKFLARHRIAADNLRDAKKAMQDMIFGLVFWTRLGERLGGFVGMLLGYLVWDVSTGLIPPADAMGLAVFYFDLTLLILFPLVLGVLAGNIFAHTLYNLIHPHAPLSLPDSDGAWSGFLQAAQQLVDELTPNEKAAAEPWAYLVMCGPFLETYLDFAEMWKKSSMQGRVLIAGSFGPGTPDLFRAAIARYEGDPGKAETVLRWRQALSQGRRGQMRLWGGLSEADVVKQVLDWEGGPREVFMESVTSGDTEGKGLAFKRYFGGNTIPDEKRSIALVPPHHLLFGRALVQTRQIVKPLGWTVAPADLRAETFKEMGPVRALAVVRYLLAPRNGGNDNELQRLREASGERYNDSDTELIAAAKRAAESLAESLERKNLNMGWELLRRKRRGWIQRAGLTQEQTESVAAHSWEMALLHLMFANSEERESPDTLLSSIVHDLPEGAPEMFDITPHDNIANEEKSERERRGLEDISADLPDFLRRYLVVLRNQYETREGNGKWVKFLDVWQCFVRALIHKKTFPGTDFGEWFASTREKALSLNENWAKGWMGSPEMPTEYSRRAQKIFEALERCGPVKGSRLGVADFSWAVAWAALVRAPGDIDLTRLLRLAALSGLLDNDDIRRMLSETPGFRPSPNYWNEFMSSTPEAQLVHECMELVRREFSEEVREANPVVSPAASWLDPEEYPWYKKWVAAPLETGAVPLFVEWGMEKIFPLIHQIPWLAWLPGWGQGILFGLLVGFVSAHIFWSGHAIANRKAWKTAPVQIVAQYMFLVASLGGFSAWFGGLGYTFFLVLIIHLAIAHHNMMHPRAWRISPLATGALLLLPIFWQGLWFLIRPGTAIPVEYFVGPWDFFQRVGESVGIIFLFPLHASVVLMALAAMLFFKLHARALGGWTTNLTLILAAFIFLPPEASVWADGAGAVLSLWLARSVWVHRSTLVQKLLLDLTLIRLSLRHPHEFREINIVFKEKGWDDPRDNLVFWRLVAEVLLSCKNDPENELNFTGKIIKIVKRNTAIRLTVQKIRDELLKKPHDDSGNSTGGSGASGAGEKSDLPNSGFMAMQVGPERAAAWLNSLVPPERPRDIQSVDPRGPVLNNLLSLESRLRTDKDFTSRFNEHLARLHQGRGPQTTRRALEALQRVVAVERALPFAEPSAEVRRPVVVHAVIRDRDDLNRLKKALSIHSIHGVHRTLILSLNNPFLAHEAGAFENSGWRTKIDVNRDVLEESIVDQNALEKALFRQMEASFSDGLDIQLTLALPEGVSLGQVAENSPYKRALILVLTALGGVRLSLHDFEGLTRLARLLALHA